ncbi:hypothetical protein MBENS4_4429 [Novosphingobium sp. MBES04]|nr:hypothetical protein MBENS4_4429 [Novosphingobium sp. MBES04]
MIALTGIRVGRPTLGRKFSGENERCTQAFVLWHHVAALDGTNARQHVSVLFECLGPTLLLIGRDRRKEADHLR